MEEETYYEAFKYVAYFVEATDTEHSLLWCRHQPQAVAAMVKGLPKSSANIYNGPALDWEGNSNIPGRMIQVGTLKKKPVVIHLRFDLIEGEIVCFYHATSQVVSYPKIEKWLKAHGVTSDVRGAKNACNASNFHECIRELQKRRAAKV